MFLNLFWLVFIYSLFFSIIFILGKFANNYLFRFKELSFGETGILGFISIYSIILITHFIIPISDFFIYSTYSLLLIFFLREYQNFFIFKNIRKFTFIITFVVFIILAITNNHHDDLYIYQLPIINYMQNYKIIFGLININDFIGQGHSFYEIMSLFKFPVYENRAYFLIPIIFVNFFVIYLFEILKIEKNLLVKYFIYFIIILLIIRYNRSKEYGTDIPILCLLFYIQINFFRYINKKEFDYFLKAVLASMFCIILKLYGILSIFYLLAFLPIMKKNFFQIFKKKKILIFIILIFSLTIIKNLIVSGCLFYPISETCINKKTVKWSISKEVAGMRHEFYNAQVLGWRSYTKNINNRNFISAKSYLNKNILEKAKGLFNDKDSEKIIAGLVLVTLFLILFLFSNKKKKINNMDQFTNFLISLCLFLPFLIWLIKFPQSRYGYFSYISCFVFFASFNYFKIGMLSKKFLISLFSIFLIFLIIKNFIRIGNEIKSESYDQINYPIKKFKENNYKIKFIDGIQFNIPTESFMECSNIPMLCAANQKMIDKVSVINGYYFIENNISELKKHINRSAVHDMIDTNN